MTKYTLKFPFLLHGSEKIIRSFIYMLQEKLSSDAHIRIYSNGFVHPYGIRRKFTTQRFSIFETERALAIYFGLYDAYSDSIDEYISSTSEVIYSNITEDCVKILKRVQKDINELVSSKDPLMPEELYNNLIEGKLSELLNREFEESGDIMENIFKSGFEEFTGRKSVKDINKPKVKSTIDQNLLNELKTLNKSSNQNKHNKRGKKNKRW